MKHKTATITCQSHMIGEEGRNCLLGIILALWRSWMSCGAAGSGEVCFIRRMSAKSDEDVGPSTLERLYSGSERNRRLRRRYREDTTGWGSGR